MRYWLVLCLCVGSFHVSTLAMPLRILIENDAPAPVRFAAEELKRYVSASTSLSVRLDAVDTAGRPLTLCMLSENDQPPASFGMPVNQHVEAYRIVSFGKESRLFSANSPRAVLYAVYDYLETELGYRWYFPYPEDVVAPTISEDAWRMLMQRSVDREEVPAFPFREREFRDVFPMTEETDARILQQIDWWAKLRMNRFLLNFNYAMNPALWKRWKTTLIPEIKKRGMLVGLGEHGSYPLFLSPDRYAADHPDWYCAIDGKRADDMRGKQFCTTNPDAFATYLENFEDFVRENPEVDFYYPAPNDVSKWCECERCSQSSIADRYMQLDNQIAAMLQRVKPGTRVMHLAYSNHRLPPENVTPHPMIDVDVACWGRNFAYPLQDQRTMPDNEDYLEVFKQWAAICRNVPGETRPQLLYHSKLMRHYWLGLHLQPLEIVDGDFEAAQALQLDGFDFPLGFVGIWTKGLSSYVVAKKCWTPDLPADRWVDEFYTRYYGEGAATARSIYALVEEAFHDLRYGSSLGLAWHPEMIRMYRHPRTGLGDHAANAVRKLEEGIAMAESCAEKNGEIGARFRKLATVLRNARNEQLVLVKLDALAQSYTRYQKAIENQQALLKLAREAYEETLAANESLAKQYRVEADLAGLYWAGTTHTHMANALQEWGEAISELSWQAIGGWKTADFVNENEVTVLRIDITDQVRALDAPYPNRFQVKFVYSAGELGATTKAVTLWKHDPSGNKEKLSGDRHSGFAGYVHNHASYHLKLPSPPDATARYVLQVELMAFATHGTVADRGCNGSILIGFPE